MKHYLVIYSAALIGVSLISSLAADEPKPQTPAAGLATGNLRAGEEPLTQAESPRDF